MAAIAGDWVEAGGLSVALCEDVAQAAGSAADGCAVQHVVRGGDLGATHCDVVTTGCRSHRTATHVHGEQAFEYDGLVRPGDVLTTTGEVTRLRQRARLELVEVTTTSVNQRGETVVRGTWTAEIRSG